LEKNKRVKEGQRELHKKCTSTWLSGRDRRAEKASRGIKIGKERDKKKCIKVHFHIA
jgi:hypothetical protein